MQKFGSCEIILSSIPGGNYIPLAVLAIRRGPPFVLSVRFPGYKLVEGVTQPASCALVGLHGSQIGESSRTAHIPPPRTKQSVRPLTFLSPDPLTGIVKGGRGRTNQHPLRGTGATSGALHESCSSLTQQGTLPGDNNSSPNPGGVPCMALDAADP